VVHALKKRHTLEELLIFLALAGSRIFHDEVECIAVQDPQVAICLSLDGSGTRSVVEQGQLSECLPW
jgi:hypothetical protein